MPEPRTVKIQVQLPEDLRTRFKAKCVINGTTMNDIVVGLIAEWTGKDEVLKQPSQGEG